MARICADGGQKTAGHLLDTQAADRPGDDQLLDLLGALEDVVDLSKASLPVQWVSDKRFGFPGFRRASSKSA
jgi:hypothetical protein